MRAVARHQLGLYGSLGATGKGHGTARAVILGLEGVLPGGLKGKRRAARLHHQLMNETELHGIPPGTMGRVNLYALAVNEENAAGIAMEHNPGLTCDPVGGLVQVP